MTRRKAAILGGNAKAAKAKADYASKPKFCEQCQIQLDFISRDNSFCSHSCASKNKCATRGIWNKGLTKETDHRVATYANKTSKRTRGRSGKRHSQEVKDHLSTIQKKNMREGKLHNIGENRWKCEASYPETFFRRVIENEFDDKHVTLEYPIKRYSIDFAWIHKKFAIEIDGEQHRQKKQRLSDLNKDLLLTSLGWKVLRIRWADMYNNTKFWIQWANNFINNAAVTQIGRVADS